MVKDRLDFYIGYYIILLQCDIVALSFEQLLVEVHCTASPSSNTLQGEFCL